MNNERNSVKIRLANKIFTKNLIHYGFIIGKTKSKNIKLPKFLHRELYLAFLLGYFDGDGKQGTTKIVSGSKIFLELIKNKFNLKSFISLTYTKAENKNYEMALTPELFNEMLINYEYSLKRKRIRFETQEERIKRLRDFASKKKKFNISKEKLEELVQQMPIIKIPEKTGFSYSTIQYWIKKYEIKIPGRKSWLNRSKNK